MDAAGESRPRPAVRLIFEYEGDDVRLVAQQPVDVAVPGFDLAQVPHPGHYVETRTAADDFDHPKLPQGHPLRRHLLYRLGRSPTG